MKSLIHYFVQLIPSSGSLFLVTLTIVLKAACDPENCTFTMYTGENQPLKTRETMNRTMMRTFGIRKCFLSTGDQHYIP